MQPPEVAKALLALSSAFRADVSEVDAELWNALLVDASDAAVEVAVAHWIRTERFFPKPAELLQAVALEAARIEAIGRGESMAKKQRADGTCVTCDPDSPGWIIIETRGRAGVPVQASARCGDCNPRPPVTEHAKGCSCVDCHYKPGHARRIRSGRDGMPDRAYPDPLEPVAAVQQRAEF